MQLKTIEKALMVFKCFAQSDTTLGTTELANKLNTNTTTMSRVLTTLKKHEFLEKDQNSGRYRFGPAMVEIARAVFRTLDGAVTTEATPFIDTLRDKVEERVHLEIISGNNIYLAYLAETPKPISLKIGVGDQVMPHAHAGAKAIVAFSQPDVIDSWLSRDLIHYTNKTISDPARIRKMYEEIRKNGIAYDFGEYIEEINAIGAPIFNHLDIPVAAVIIVVPTYRMKKNWPPEFITMLKTTANTISSRLQSSRTI
jgi:DNA-binding IclR family transcriptional regulator